MSDHLRQVPVGQVHSVPGHHPVRRTSLRSIPGSVHLTSTKVETGDPETPGYRATPLLDFLNLSTSQPGPTLSELRSTSSP
ncbi:hypothetical protein N7462_010476 [Penicillium macrosclerotiorum]|uniref:uncharacterized protein n=1 Tax=Penicillium macrosclerotiorum TaxID=303699 RepID=UPI0025465BAB|nr:uncharacterized protein N7462_010476 [Penicillium macrosclerotiorum]KAJ5669406.1 hypothetical protein N7462_010476 [Penicillium macrosclerotiorum]